MQILTELINSINPAPIKYASVGIYSCLVESRVSGLASNLQQGCCGHSQQPIDPYSFQNAKELAKLILGKDIFKASLGMAALNSLIPHPKKNTINTKGQHLLLEKGRGKKVAVIGHFPFVERYHSEFKQLDVFEKRPKPGDLRDTDIPARLPDAEVIAMTATTLINHTFEEVMQYCNPNSFMIMMGPSTPFSPLLFKYGINALCGSIVIKKKDIRKEVSLALPFRCMHSIQPVAMLSAE